MTDAMGMESAASDLLLGFLDRNAGRMPRTALSYATEHFDPGLPAHYRALPRPTTREGTS